jgi:hypothetical protein
MQLGRQPRSHPRVYRQNLRIPHDTECRSVAFSTGLPNYPLKPLHLYVTIENAYICLPLPSGAVPEQSTQLTNPQPGPGFWGSPQTVCSRFWTNPHVVAKEISFYCLHRPPQDVLH